MISILVYYLLFCRHGGRNSRFFDKSTIVAAVAGGNLAYMLLFLFTVGAAAIFLLVPVSIPHLFYLVGIFSKDGQTVNSEKPSEAESTSRINN